MLKSEVGSSSSVSTAYSLEIKIYNLQFPSVDVTLDGADEIDADLNAIKGGGAWYVRSWTIRPFSLIMARASQVNSGRR